MLMRPGRPLLGEVLQQQVAEGLAVVAHNLRVALLEQQQIVLQTVAAPLLKLVEEGRRPRGLAHLVGVVEESMGVGGLRALEGCLDVGEVVTDGLAVEMVYHQSLTAWRSPLHLHHTVADMQGHDLPLGGLQLLQFQLERLAGRLVGSGLHLSHHHLLGTPGQASVAHVGRHVVGLPFPVGHYPVQTAVGGIFLCDGEVKRLHLLAGEGLVDEHHLTGTLLQRYPRPTEGPASTSGHVHLDAQPLSVGLHLAQHRHPLVGEVGDVVALVALYTIDGCDLQGPDAVAGILLHGPLQVVLVHSRAEPPPAGSRLRLLSHFRPLLGSCRHRAAHQRHQPKYLLHIVV